MEKLNQLTCKNGSAYTLMSLDYSPFYSRQSVGHGGAIWVNAIGANQMSKPHAGDSGAP